MFAGAFWFPGAIHEGKGIGRIAIDDRATREQRTAILNIATGKEGDMPWEIFSAVTETYLDPLIARIEFETDRNARVARLNAPNLGEFRIEPIKNPITAQEHRAIIKLPQGFEYKEAEMGNTTLMRATVGDKKLQNRDSYAQLAAVEGTNV